ncbi:MAG: GAF domain-containing protein [Desulfobacteraceae bacterium]|nr:GAF domain-containing protein [Desulfobacteraceae bacterium]
MSLKEPTGISVPPTAPEKPKKGKFHKPAPDAEDSPQAYHSPTAQEIKTLLEFINSKAKQPDDHFRDNVDPQSPLLPVIDAVSAIKEEFQSIYRKQKNTEKINRILYKISTAVNTTFNLDELYRSIHATLSEIIDVTHFFIALYDKERDAIVFPFNTDEVDVDWTEISDASNSTCLTGEVIQTGKPLFIKKEEMEARAKRLNSEIVGVPSHVWLGVPLHIKGEVIGAMVVQSYTDQEQYAPKDVELLHSVSDQVAIAIERKLTTDSLRETEARYRHLAENLDDIIFFTDSNSAFTYISPAIKPMLGYDPEELTGPKVRYEGPEDGGNRDRWFRHCEEKRKDQGTCYQDLIHPDDRAGVLAAVTQAIQTLTPYRLEYRFRKKNGKYHRVSEKGYVFSTEDGGKRIEGVINDIQDHHHTKEINQTLFDISNAVNTTKSLDELYRSIHKSLSRVMDVTNFFIALYDAETNTGFFPYYEDQYDDYTNYTQNFDSEKSLTGLLIRSRRPTFFRKPELIRLSGEGRVRGTVPLTWVGVPLLVDEEVIGSMVVQSYSDPNLYDNRDVDILSAVSEQVAIAIDRKRSEEALIKSERQVKMLSQQTEQFSLAAASVITMEDDRLIYGRIAKAIAEYSDFKRVMISYFTDTPPFRKIISHQNYHSEEVKSIGAQVLPPDYYKKLFKKSHPLGQYSYYLPKTIEKCKKRSSAPLEFESRVEDDNVWDAGDNLHVGLKDNTGELIGLISVDTSKSGSKPSDETVKPLEIFASLVTQIIIHKRAQEELARTKKYVESANQELVAVNDRLGIAIKRASEMTRKAEAATRAKSEFLANMSHEIRTPINAVIGFTELLLNTETTEKQQDYLKTLQVSGQSLLGIINDILDFSKIEAGKLELEKTEIMIADFMHTIGNMFFNAAAEKNIRISMDLDTGLPEWVLGDPLRLRQVLVNLINNAIKFTEDGVVDISCSLIERVDSSVKLEFKVSDTGIGITQEQQTMLFDPFAQADGSTTRKYGGTGLGLTISKRLVEMMDGVIRLDSKPGEGSSFSFYARFEEISAPVNLRAGDLPDGETMANTCVDTLETDIFAGRRVLLVEDNPINQRVAFEMLTALNIHIKPVSNGAEALKAIENGVFDIILMDIQMPEMDGYEATRLLQKIFRDDRGHRPIPIIAMTAHAMKGDREKCLATGMDDYMTKPISMKILHTALKHWLTVSENIDRRQQRSTSERTVYKDTTSNGSSDKCPAVHGEIPGVEMDSAIRRFSGNTDLLLELLAEFVRDYGNTPESIRHEINCNNTETAIRLAHSLKGVAGNLSATAIYTMAFNLETAIKKETPENIDVAIEELHEEMDRLVHFMNTHKDIANE